MIVFVGDKPSPRMRPGAKPFEGAACEQRLKEWIDFVKPFFLPRPVGKHYEIVNQCDHVWAELYYWHCMGHKLVALGNNASKALKGIPHFKLPHPSGSNRQINNKKFIKAKLEECKKWLYEEI